MISLWRDYWYYINTFVEGLGLSHIFICGGGGGGSGEAGQHHSPDSHVQISQASAGHLADVRQWPLKSADSWKLAGSLQINGRPLAVFKGHRLLICQFHSRLGGAPNRQTVGMRSCFYDWKNREGVGKFSTWPGSAPIANWRHRWLANTPDNPQINTRKSP